MGADGEPRGVIDPNGDLNGPVYEFDGIDTEGFVAYTSRQGSDLVDLSQSAVLASPATIEAIDGNSTFLGRPAYRVTLTSAAMGNTNNRYVHYQAELLNGVGTVVGEFRILSHTDRSPRVVRG